MTPRIDPAKRTAAKRGRRHGGYGMTLVELLVAMAIGLGVTLAVTSMLIASENQKRSTTSTNDAEQTGAYAFNAIDKAVRSAGSGFAQSAYGGLSAGLLGCRLNAGTFLPRTGTPFPAPFATNFLSGTTGNLRVAPVLIAASASDTGSDVLVVMGGSGAAGGVSRQVSGGGSANTLTLDNSVGFNVNDLGLVSQNSVLDCLIEQVSTTPTTPTLTLGGTYYTAGATTTLATFASNTASYLTPLGNAGINNLQFQMFGVGTNRILYSYDLLRNLQLYQATGGDVAEAIADGVDQMHVIYGIATGAAGAGIQNTWAGPSDAGYDITSVMTTPTTQQQIVSVRIALVLRGQYPSKTAVSPSSLTIFSNLTNFGGTSLTQVIPLAANDRFYRYRVFEFTVPVRNMLLLAGVAGGGG